MTDLNNIPQNIRTNVELKEFTTYKVGGKARYFASPKSVSEIRKLILWTQENNIPYFLLGKGSNIVMSDQGFGGLILYFGEEFAQHKIEGNTVWVQAGMLLWDLIKSVNDSGLQGMENMLGIPGTIGGGVFINAGAFDHDLSQTCTEVKSMDLQGTIITRNNKECQFGYRTSVFSKVREIILEATFELTPSSPTILHEQSDEIWKRRQNRQPLEYPNAGSMFKRPPGNFAGKLIQDAGLKGFQMGGAQISEKHANFVINKDDACAQDICDLSEEVIIRVEKDSGIRLQREQIFVGNFLPWPR